MHVPEAVGYMGLTYLVYRHFDPSIEDFFEKDHSPFLNSVTGSVEFLGLGKTQTYMVAGTAVTAFLLRKEQLKKLVIIWTGSLLLNSIVTDELKRTFQRHRPNSDEVYNDFDWRNGPGVNTSFPSAHTSNAFTTATAFATVYKDKKWIPFIAYSLAGLVGVSRVYHNAHWASDVLTGAAVGFGSAKAINLLYRFAGSRLSFLPYAGREFAGFELVYQFK